jgi:tRNA-intron endonuclease
MAKRQEIIATIFDKNVVTEDSDYAREIYNQKRYGEIKNRKVYLSFFEALFLIEKGWITVLDGRKKSYDVERFMQKAKKIKDFLTHYTVFKDLRSRGYVVKTALKFGAAFRVYDKGIKPGEDHAKWVVFPVHETETQTWKDFSAKNRVAHSTRKKLLIGVVDAELDISYWEASWVKP